MFIDNLEIAHKPLTTHSSKQAAASTRGRSSPEQGPGSSDLCVLCLLPWPGACSEIQDIVTSSVFIYVYVYLCTPPLSPLCFSAFSSIFLTICLWN